LLYTLEQGPTEQFILEQCAQDGFRRIPDAIANAPELDPSLGLFWSAFWDLNSCRSAGMALGPIPWTAMQQWCTLYGVSGEQQADLEFLVGQLDAAFLKWSNRKSDNKG
jgi:hypothetical protein